MSSWREVPNICLAFMLKTHSFLDHRGIRTLSTERDGSNRPHFLRVYRRDNPSGMLGEHEKSGFDGFFLTIPSQKLKKGNLEGSLVHVFDSVCIKGRHSFQRAIFKKYLHSCVKNDSANKFNNMTS